MLVCLSVPIYLFIRLRTFLKEMFMLSSTTLRFFSFADQCHPHILYSPRQSPLQIFFPAHLQVLKTTPNMSSINETTSEVETAWNMSNGEWIPLATPKNKENFLLTATTLCCRFHFAEFLWCGCCVCICCVVSKKSWATLPLHDIAPRHKKWQLIVWHGTSS